jgi:hypothetical protein
MTGYYLGAVEEKNVKDILLRRKYRVTKVRTAKRLNLLWIEIYKI